MLDSLVNHSKALLSCASTSGQTSAGRTFACYTLLINKTKGGRARSFTDRYDREVHSLLMRLLASRSSLVVSYEPQEGKCDDEMGRIYILSTTFGTQWDYVNVSHIIAHENKSYLSICNTIALACSLALRKLVLVIYPSCFNINCCRAQN